MNITHLRYVAIATPDFDGSRAFFTTAWGLRDTGVVQDGVAYLQTRSTEAFQLALLRGPERSVERIAFGLNTKADVDAAAAELTAAGVPVIEAPHALETPGAGYGLRFLDPDYRCVELSSDVTTGAAGEPGPVPQKLAHIVLNTPDIDRATEFYRDRLGFRISDWSEHVMSFLRCNPEHHSIAFNVAPHAAYNHTSWTMDSIDDLMRAQGRVRAAGTELQWGTGRHGPGHQVFNYYIEPSGYVVELIADGIEIPDEDAWKSQVWVRTPEHMDLWGTAGFPNTGVRSAMTGTPDPASERTRA